MLTFRDKKGVFFEISQQKCNIKAVRPASPKCTSATYVSLRLHPFTTRGGMHREIKPQFPVPCSHKEMCFSSPTSCKPKTSQLSNIYSKTDLGRGPRGNDSSPTAQDEHKAQKQTIKSSTDENWPKKHSVVGVKSLVSPSFLRREKALQTRNMNIKHNMSRKYPKMLKISRPETSSNTNAPTFSSLPLPLASLLKSVFNSTSMQRIFSVLANPRHLRLQQGLPSHSSLQK